MIVACDCKHEAQDRLHGKGMRVKNPTAKSGLGPNQVEVRCTVCKKESVVTR